MTKTLRISVGAVLLIVAVSIGFFSLQTDVITVTVRNSGAQKLSPVSVTTADQRYTLGDIEPGGSAKLGLNPVRDTDLMITSSAGRSRVNAYLTRGYVGEISVNLDGRVVKAVKDDLCVGWC